VKQAENAVGGFLPGAGRCAHAKTADVHRHGSFDHARENLSRDDDPGIGASFAGRVLDVFPISARLPGTASMLRNSSGAGGSAASFSRWTSVP
jgi:hypothetical protein